MKEKIIVNVTGGKLIAEPNTDPNYPGISIAFLPDCGGGNTELALLEECDRELVLRSWMDLSREDPTSLHCSYDDVLLSQVAYGMYLARCQQEREVPFSMQGFAENLFYNADYMKGLLTEDLFKKYENIMVTQEEK